jgi:hypothetical protein
LSSLFFLTVGIHQIKLNFVIYIEIFSKVHSQIKESQYTYVYCQGVWQNITARISTLSDNLSSSAIIKRQTSSLICSAGLAGPYSGSPAAPTVPGSVHAQEIQHLISSLCYWRYCMTIRPYVGKHTYVTCRLKLIHR